MYQSTQFWEDMAKRYPRFDDPSMSRDVTRMIEQSLSCGIDFYGSRVLDIGCGTGTVAIPLALKGAEVTAIDLSESMLDTLQRDAERAGVGTQITTARSDWEGYRVDRPYDIVIASMTPAVSNDSHLDKMLRSATKAGIYVGWGAYRVNRTLKRLFEAHRYYYPMLSGSAHRFTEKLMRRGIGVETRYFESAWEERMPQDEAASYARNQLTQHGITPDDAILESVFDAHRDGDFVLFHTEAEKGVLAWHL